MRERIFVIDQRYGESNVLVGEYRAPHGLNREWMRADRNFGGSCEFIPVIVASSLKRGDQIVFEFTRNVSERNKEEFRKAFIDAVMTRVSE